jgi:hypothetical protein
MIVFIITIKLQEYKMESEKFERGSYLIYLYCSPDEFTEIKSALSNARIQPSGKIRIGDVSRLVMLNWARDGGKI